MKAAPKPADEQFRLETLMNYEILDTGPDAGLDQITSYVARQFDAPKALLSIIDSKRQWVKSSYGADGGPQEFKRPDTFCAHTILSNDINCVLDASKDARFAENPFVTAEDGLRFYCGVPLTSENGQHIGSLCIIDEKPRSDFSQADRDLLMDMAKMAMLHVNRYKKKNDTDMKVLDVNLRNNNPPIFTADQTSIKSFIDLGLLPMALVGLQGEYVAKSSSWQRFMARAYGQKDADNFSAHNSANPNWYLAFNEAIQSGNTTQKRLEALEMLNGQLEYIDWFMQPWAQMDGTISGAMICFSIETDAFEARKEVEEQNELVNAVLGNIKEGIVACDAQGNLNLFNGSTRRMHGLELVNIPLDECGDFYDLYEADGSTPLTVDRIPLMRALKGEYVCDAEMVIAPKMLTKLDIVTQAQPLYRNDGTLIGAVASMTDITETKRVMKRLKDSEAHAKKVAFSDTLTGLANRAAFTDYYLALDEEKLTDQQTVYCVDLNGFKLVNDTLGHDIGDDVLKCTSNRLQELADENSFIARVGGDEFIIVQRAQSVQDAEIFAQSIIDALEQPIKTGNQSFTIGCCVGIACAPYHGDTIAELLRRADFAMIHAKLGKSNAPVLFQPKFELDTVKKRILQQELLGSIERDELEVYFQPIMCGQTVEIRGVEALVRWNHPDRGLVAPGEFIEIAEESGFMTQMGEWVLESALAKMADHDDLFISVNLSPVQFMDPNLVDNMLAIIDRSGVDPKRLEFEVTESILVNDTFNAQRIIKAFKAKGIRIALDDFGTGYSSLSYINQFPFDKIKIDRSFINDLCSNTQSEAIVECVINLAKSLGMNVTAEGVETKEHESKLQLMGCRTLQGFKYSKPLPIAGLLSFLQNLKQPMGATA